MTPAEVTPGTTIVHQGRPRRVTGITLIADSFCFELDGDGDRNALFFPHDGSRGCRIRQSPDHAHSRCKSPVTAMFSRLVHEQKARQRLFQAFIGTAILTKLFEGWAPRQVSLAAAVIGPSSNGPLACRLR